MLHGNFQAFLAPNAFDTLVVYSPPVHPQQIRNGSIAVAAISTGVVDNRFTDQNIVGCRFRLVTLRTTILGKNGASLTLAYSQFFTDTLNATAATGGA
ncbi:hypothetical protein KL86DPRO_60221 [uncultured delta proteobacterium]|uniref:Uncharacterized protein n=1 Tax=uncultured delta proteobacterium TaxID=34034 RepID=A0A212KG56_9DELT|nr:hypothetical protein KL86DPRO_30128 [uncultured delta proteobacterium]SBW10598.1 hypothetical protein KL86DPRO_60221 [uncultured delta proteobacterium]